MPKKKCPKCDSTNVKKIGTSSLLPTSEPSYARKKAMRIGRRVSTFQCLESKCEEKFRA